MGWSRAKEKPDSGVGLGMRYLMDHRLSLGYVSGRMLGDFT